MTKPSSRYEDFFSKMDTPDEMQTDDFPYMNA